MKNDFSLSLRRFPPAASAFTLVKAAALVTALALAGCGGGGSGAEGQLTGTVRIDGSSTVFPLTAAVAEQFMEQHPRVRVAVSKSGTGGGFAKFLRGETAINDASRPISQGEIQTARQQNINFIELPVAYDGLVVVTNPQNDWVQCLTTEELQQIWEPGSNIENWNQVRSSFPDQPLKLYGPGTASGTFDYFTEAIVGESGASRTDYNASEDDNVLVQGVQGDPGALGFFGLAYYENNAERLKLLGVDNNPPLGTPNATGGTAPDTARTGCVQPSVQTVSQGTYQPLSRPLFIYVSQQEASDPATQAFVRFYLKNIGDLAREVGYVPLTDQEYQLALQRFENRTTGSMFEGEGAQVGASLEQLLRQGQGATDTTAAPADTAVTAAASRLTTDGG